MIRTIDFAVAATLAAAFPTAAMAEEITLRCDGSYVAQTHGQPKDEPESFSRYFIIDDETEKVWIFYRDERHTICLTSPCVVTFSATQIIAESESDVDGVRTREDHRFDRLTGQYTAQSWNDFSMVKGFNTYVRADCVKVSLQDQKF